MVWLQMTDSSEILSPKPAIPPPLDSEFHPISLGNREYRKLVSTSNAKDCLAIALERNGGHRSVFRTDIVSPESGSDAATLLFVERLVKFLLWQIGGWKITLGGPREIGNFIAQVYSRGGARAFDVNLMEQVYEQPEKTRALPFV